MMMQRKQLNRLVIATLDGRTMRAVTLYDELRNADPRILREEKVHGAKSLGKIISTFPDVVYTRTKPKYYTLKKNA